MKDWFKLSKNNIYGIIFYYFILFICSLTTAIFLIGDFLDCISTTQSAIIGGIAFGILGTTIFYSKKLYKACINLDINPPMNGSDKTRAIGVVLYFILRPIFAIVFSILIILLLKMSVKIVSLDDAKLTNEFVYLTCVLSFFSGFSAGDVLDIIEVKSKSVIQSFFNKDEI